MNTVILPEMGKGYMGVVTNTLEALGLKYRIVYPEKYEDPDSLVDAVWSHLLSGGVVILRGEAQTVPMQAALDRLHKCYPTRLFAMEYQKHVTH